MKSLRCFLLFCLMLGAAAMAENEPHIGYIYPAGGQQGAVFQVTVGGRYLNASNVYCSGAGVSATILKYERQVTPTEQKELQERLSAIQEKRKQGRLTAEEIKSAEEIRQKLNNFGRQLTNLSLGEFVTLQIVVAPNAEPGNREIRLLTANGFSNPIKFNVGKLSEITKKVWKNIPKEKGSMDPELDPKPTEVDVTLPVTINGQIPPGGVDRYRFAAREGQQIVVMVRARDLIPYISDAVPGWFQAAVTLYDESGKKLAYIDDYRFNPDPLLVYKVAAAGEYTLEIKDALYRGREDFVYRTTISEQLDVTASNRMTVAGDTLPEIFEKEPNNTVEASQLVAVPVIISGHIDQSGDIDVFRFEGKKDEPIVAEVYARRLDSSLDSMLILTDASGRQLALNDDHEDKGAGLNTHHADSYIAVTLPEAGAYFIHIRDTQQAGGEAYSYRLRVSEPRPDFELRVTPSSLNVHGGASAPVTAHALRKDGFTGEIALELRDAPKGFTLTGAKIPVNQDQVRFTLNAPATAMEPFDLQFEGRAAIDGREVVRTAVPADDMMQAFSYRHLVPAQELKVAVTGRFRAGGEPAQILGAVPVKISAGGTGSVRVQIPAGPQVTKIEYELSEPPDGITIKESTATEIVFSADAEKVKPGFTGNLIVNAFTEPAKTEENQSGNRRRIPLGALPAISYEIIVQ